jgi:nicotinamide-nucleotide amidase
MTLIAEPQQSLTQESTSELAQRAVDLAWSLDGRIAVAESCTAGSLAAALALADGANACFLGGMIAYSPDAKYTLLGVPPGPVVSEEAARQMACGALQRFDADVAVATTGVIGPVQEEGQPVGTLWLGGCIRGGPSFGIRKQLTGSDPTEHRDAAVREALRLMIDMLHAHA